MKIAPQAWRFVIAGVLVDFCAMALIIGGALGARMPLLAAGVLLSFLATASIAYSLYRFRVPDAGGQL